MLQPPHSPSVLVAVPESRERETLSLLLRNRGVEVLEVPLVSILDAPDPQPVRDWLLRFINQPIDLFVILTGEGLRRLLGFAEKEGLSAVFVAKLETVPTLVRGPKPEKALQELGLTASYKSEMHTSVGVLTALQAMDLANKRVALQLYGNEPNPSLVNGIKQLGAAVDIVAPYVYASQEEEDGVAAFIERLALGEIGMVAFTSQSQWHRLQEVASKRNLLPKLAKGLSKAALAAVGPVIKAQLEQAGYSVEVMPPRLYFMKPLVTEIVRYLEARGLK